MTPRTPRHIARVAAVVLAAALLNSIVIPLPAGIALFLGPILTMPLVLVLRAPWAVLAPAVSMAVTLHAHGHPGVWLVMVTEAAWLALARLRWRRSAVLHDVLFWAIAAGPVYWALGPGIFHLPTDIAGLMTANLVVNQVAAVMTAVVLLRHTPLANWLVERKVPRRRIRDTIFHSVFVLAVVPLTVVGLSLAVLLRLYCDREDRDQLCEAAERCGQQLSLFLRLHESAIAGLGRQLSRGAVDPQVALEETRAALPAFLTMLVADAKGRVIHAATSGGAVVTSTGVADREYFRAARDLGRVYVSGVFRGRGFGNDLLVAISAPFYDPAGRFAGVVEASLEVHQFAQLVVGKRKNREIELIFADHSGRVIFSDAGGGLRPLARLRHFAQGALFPRPRNDDPLVFDAPNARGENTRFVAYGARAEGSRVTVIAQRPLLAGLDGAEWIFSLFAVVLMGIAATALWVVRDARRKMVGPLEEFAVATERQAAAGIVEPVASRFPALPQEVWVVFRTFNQLAGRLQASYDALRRTNEELDRRVIQRTAEAEAARRQAEAANQSKTDFLAATSHEIRTPLNAIIGLADHVAQSVREADGIRRLDTIRAAGRRLLTVVNDLLDLSRAEAGKLELCAAPFELTGWCRELQALFELQAAERGLALRLEIGREPLWLLTDGTRLQQILINLLGNAFKFTRAGEVRLVVERGAETAAGVELRFAVRDTGPGIPPDQQTRLFQPYVQLPGVAASAVPGTGLGLFISRRLVGLFGGALAVRSEVGRGTEFYFSLTIPRADAPMMAAGPAVPPSDPARLRILAADDNPANQEVLRCLLEPGCERLVVVDDGAAALAELARERFDVALIDLEMPGQDGCAVARAVRAWNGQEASRGCRLVALTAHGRDQVWARCVEHGFDDFVAKPVERVELRRALRAAAPELVTR